MQKLAEFLNQKKIPLRPEDYLNDLGTRLYTKTTEVLQSEIEDVTLEDCVAYIWDLVIQRTFEGYKTEKRTVYEQLAGRLKDLRVAVETAPDEIDRIYNVDFVSRVKGKMVRIQIKPITYQQMPEAHKWLEWQGETHERFTDRFGGQVFLIFSVTEGKQKRIANPETIEDIRNEVVRLRREEG